MRISESRLRKILIKLISESTILREYSVRFNSRPIFGGLGQHSWITVSEPGGKTTSLSGKTGAAFTMSRVAAALWGGRNNVTDRQFIEKYEAFKDGKLDSEDWEAAKAALDWSTLRGIRNWASDAPANAQHSVEISPPDGVDSRGLVAIMKAAFDGYDGNSPYEPLPELSGNTSDRNSNSFAFSLLRSAFDGAIPPNVPTSTMVWPGLTQTISSIVAGGQAAKKKIMGGEGADEDTEYDDSDYDERLGGDYDYEGEGDDDDEEAGVSESTLNRNSLRSLIIEALFEGEVVDLEKYRQSRQPDPEQEWFDLFDEEELQKYKTRGRLRQQTIEDPEREATEDETFEEYLQGIESGKVVDMFDDDPISEAKSDGAAYTGTLGTAQQVPTADDAGAAADKCQIDRDEIENVTNQYNNEKDQQQKKAYQDQLRVLTQNHNKSKSQGGCGP